MINFPDPVNYLQALTEMLVKNVDYIEVQLPFSNPLADGDTIHKAHNLALQYKFNFFEELSKIADLKKQTKSKSKLVLMSYLTPVFYFGIDKVLKALKENNFTGIIIPDLSLGSNEQLEVCEISKNLNLQWIPLISPLTTKQRLDTIKTNLQQGQLIYATARKGKTGSKTDFDNPEIQAYFNFLKSNLTDFQILIGFGVKTKNQLDYLNQQGFLAVIASELINRINESPKDLNLQKEVVSNFLTEFGYL